MARRFTVVWLAHGNPVATKVRLAPGQEPARIAHDDWLVRALRAHRAEIGAPLSAAQAQAMVEDEAPGLAAVVRGHNALAWAP